MHWRSHRGHVPPRILISYSKWCKNALKRVILAQKIEKFSDEGAQPPSQALLLVG